MTLAFWILAVIGVLVALAILIEYSMKRGRYRPLSTYAVNQRRWDDPASDRSPVSVTGGTWVRKDHEMNDGRTYMVSKDPQVQAIELMPSKARKD
ncbi:hypothetical protein [Pseudoruegeria sp. HB172150]|uniref:hypothetical protein n=1 Tax=Pseudoruegeria sp. HB172150 TaxID=2721164 RepID=UPI001557231A|nr:hypothetical protein [Pseudoruegeria sp. HB172150]